MPNILIHGATGTVGNATALALLRSGNHTVYGIARTAEKARSLASQEIHPVTSPDPVNSPKDWQDVVRKHHINVVIDATTSDDGSLKLLEATKELGAERLSAAKNEDVVPPEKLGFVYTSGVWVHGDSQNRVSDLTPVGTASAPTKPAALVTARTGWEQAVLKSRDILNVVIIRPTVIYGGSSWIFDPLWMPVYAAGSVDSVQVPLNESTMAGLVHAEDVGLGMQLAAEKISWLSNTYPVFDLSTSQESLASITRAAAATLGYKGKIEMAGPGENPFFRALNTSINTDTGRAKTLLGWQPKRVGGVQPRIDVYATAWKAHKEMKA